MTTNRQQTKGTVTHFIKQCVPTLSRRLTITDVLHCTCMIMFSGMLMDVCSPFVFPPPSSSKAHHQLRLPGRPRAYIQLPQLQALDYPPPLSQQVNHVL